MIFTPAHVAILHAHVAAMHVDHHEIMPLVGQQSKPVAYGGLLTDLIALTATDFTIQLGGRNVVFQQNTSTHSIIGNEGVLKGFLPIP